MAWIGIGRRSLILVAVWAACALAAPASAERQSLVLLTLDTTRADSLGCYGAAAAQTPSLDGLAAGGTRYATALTSSPLTLPAHASLLTGLLPPEHGLRDNGTAVLDPSVPTLATILSARGYATAAFVASRVLDRRFGLGNGFDLYDDRMTAERIGEYGYPERDAAAVSSAAIAWLSALPPSRPYFLWAHYYDPHAPYEPPAPWASESTEAAYAGEIAYMDREIGRLLAALPQGRPRPLIAVVGDHGESLGEHGERGHGLFLYRAALEVPLILSGPGVRSARVVDEVVAIRRLPATLLRLLGIADQAAAWGPSLPGLPSPGSQPEPQPVYSETWMPANAYGWSPLEALTDQRWRLIVAPRPELYDLRADPDELRNLIGEERREARRLERTLAALEGSLRVHPTQRPPEDPELAADLRSLGYLSGSGAGGGKIDPKDGVAMLTELERAKQLRSEGESRRAAEMLRDLTARSPGNIPFLTQLAAAELDAGNPRAALAAYRQAISLNPRLEFLHLNLADACMRLGLREEARREYERTLELDRRSARAWLGLGELAHRAGETDRERRLLHQAVEAGTASAAIHLRLGQLESAAGNPEAADAHFRTATELTPRWALAWRLWGENGEARNQPTEALTRYRQAAAVDPANVPVLLRLGRLELRMGDTAEGRRHLQRAVTLAPNTAEGREAQRLLDAL